MRPAGIVARAISTLIRGYQRTIGPALPSRCRFYPTCSEYTRQAVLTHGAARGVWLGIKRIAKCHPFHPGGLDPVPRVKGHPGGLDPVPPVPPELGRHGERGPAAKQGPRSASRVGEIRGR